MGVANLTIKSDRWIREMARDRGMIEPFDRASFELEQYYSDFERDFKIVFEDINQMSAAFLNPY